MMTQGTIDTFNIDDDLQEMRLMQEERQLRLLEALHSMENNMMSDEDMSVIWFECGMPRAAFRKLN